MRCLPPRRWFQFRLSTWFVLVALLCWAMAVHPYFESVKPGHTGRFIPIPVGSHFIAVVPNPDLKMPFLALAAFVALKAAWAVVNRRRARSATHR